MIKKPLKKSKKTKIMQIRLTKKMDDDLEELAGFLQTSKSDIIRRAIDRMMKNYGSVGPVYDPRYLFED